MKKCFIFESRIFSSEWFIYAFFLVFRIYVLSFSLSLSSVFCRIFPCLQLLCFVVFFLFFVFYVFSLSLSLSFVFCRIISLSLAIVFCRIFPCLCLLCFFVFLVFVFCVSSYFSLSLAIVFCRIFLCLRTGAAVSASPTLDPVCHITVN